MSVVSNPYIFNIKNNYSSKAEINIAFTSQSWTTPGTYTWVAPFTGAIQVEVAGAGGGSGSSYGYKDRLGRRYLETSYDGGNGELKKSTAKISINNSYTIIVGKGGNAGQGVRESGSSGEDSSAFNINGKGGTGSGGTYGNDKGLAPTSYSGGGKGGAGVRDINLDGPISGNNGANGWVKITKN